MMPLAATAVWMNLVLYCATGTLLCGALLWWKRHENRKQRILQATALLTAGVWLLIHLLATCKEGIPLSGTVYAPVPRRCADTAGKEKQRINRISK